MQRLQISGTGSSSHRSGKASKHYKQTSTEVPQILRVFRLLPKQNTQETTLTSTSLSGREIKPKAKLSGNTQVPKDCSEKHCADLKVTRERVWQMF